MLRDIVLILGISLVTVSCTGIKSNSIDHLVVYKSKREMALYSQDKLVKKVPIALGKNPTQPKQHEGDGRTPEGRYSISWRNPNSQYNLSLLISYPNRNDLLQAKKQGQSPGGQIMIHGLPNHPKWPEKDYVTKDWTNGCIAVTNDVIKELFDKVRINSPIDIYP